MVNFSATSTNSYFVIFHFLGDSAYKLAARVNLGQFCPFQRPMFISRKHSLSQQRLPRSLVQVPFIGWQHQQLSMLICTPQCTNEALFLIDRIRFWFWFCTTSTVRKSQGTRSGVENCSLCIYDRCVVLL